MHTHPCLASNLLQLLGGAFDSAASKRAAGECESSASESLPDELPESESGHFKQIGQFVINSSNKPNNIVDKNSHIKMLHNSC